MLPEHLVYFGLRSTEIAEEKVIKELNIRHYPVHEVRHRGVQSCIDETLERLSGVDIIYITFDVDSLDCDLISKGTGTPVSKGFDPTEIIQLIQGIMSSNKVVCLEVCKSTFT